MEQTAVEWLVNELKESIGLKDLHAIEKAKQMFEQQIINAYKTGNEEDIYYNPSKDGKQYYNETFNKK